MKWKMDTEHKPHQETNWIQLPGMFDALRLISDIAPKAPAEEQAELWKLAVELAKRITETTINLEKPMPKLP